MEKEMDENVPHDLVLKCRRLAEQLSEDDEGLDTTSRRRKSKEKKEALQALLSLGDQGILVLLELAQRSDFSVEDALAFITLDSDHVSTIYTTYALLKRRQLAVRRQMLEALAQRSDLTSEQAAQIAEALSVVSDP
jgi:hypothetical protein